MGSSTFVAGELPAEVRGRIDETMACSATIVVGEASGASRAYQGYLESKGYRNVVVGHAAKLRYNVGSWRDVRYGKDLREREKGMIEDYGSVVWADSSGVIAGNLELLKRLGKPTYVYEYSSGTGMTKAGEIDPERAYDPYYCTKERYRKP